MYFLLFTIIYCLITQALNVGYGPAMGIYLMAVAIFKGLSSEELKNVFNLKKTRTLYKENGVKDSLIDLLSLFLIFINSYLIDYVPFSLFEFIYIFFLIVFVFRTLFWGITRTVRKRMFYNS